MNSLTDALHILGQTILNILDNRLDDELSRRYFEKCNDAIRRQAFANPWHTTYFTRHALQNIGDNLCHLSLSIPEKTGLHTAVINSDATPLDGFEDFLEVITKGDNYIGKLANNDKLLIPLLVETLFEIEPAWKERIEFVEKLPKVDSIIATDSGNATLLAYLRQHAPVLHLHKTRHNVAVVTGDETEDELRQLANNLLLYFGMGRHAISKLFVPKDYDFKPLCALIEKSWPEMDAHHQYLNHLDYQKTLLLMNRIPFLDAGKLMFVHSEESDAPISITYTETYSSSEALKARLGL